MRRAVSFSPPYQRVVRCSCRRHRRVGSSTVIVGNGPDLTIGQRVANGDIFDAGDADEFARPGLVDIDLVECLGDGERADTGGLDRTVLSAQASLTFRIVPCSTRHTARRPTYGEASIRDQAASVIRIVLWSGNGVEQCAKERLMSVPGTSGSSVALPSRAIV